jgi:hypothetical protein
VLPAEPELDGVDAAAATLAAFDGRVAEAFYSQQPELFDGEPVQRCARKAAAISGDFLFRGQVHLALVCDGRSCRTEPRQVVAMALTAPEAPASLGFRACLSGALAKGRFDCPGCRQGTVAFTWPVRVGAAGEAL